MERSKLRHELEIIEANREASRHAMNDLLSKSRRLEMLDWGPIPDGGSVVFNFQVDSGSRIWIQAVHEMELPGRPAQVNFQVVRMGMSDQRDQEFSLEVGSPLELRVLSMLERSLSELKNAQEPSPSTKERSIEWILARIKNRNAPWLPCPYARSPD
jgi:hypothetical protein